MIKNILIFIFFISFNYLSYSNNAANFFKVGDEYYKKKNYSDAITYFTKAINIDPKLSDAYYYRGKCYDYKDQYIKAVNDFVKAASLDKKYKDILNTIAYYYLRVEKKYDIALIYFIKSIENEPEEKNNIMAYLKSKNRFNLNISIEFIKNGKTTKFKYIALIPKDYENRQKIYNIKYSIEPTKKYIINDNSYVEFLVENPEYTTKIEIDIELELFKYDFSSALKLKENNKINSLDLLRFLIDEEFIEKDDPSIKQTAARFNDKDEINLVKKIYNFVLKHMSYKYIQKKEQGAVFALKNKGDDCSEYSDLFAALCRAKNIPARVVSGFILDQGYINYGHAWVEVYFKDYGWIPFDPTFDDNENKETNNTDFNKLLNVYIYLQFLRNDERLEGRSWNNLKWWGDEPDVKYSGKITIMPKDEYYHFYHLITSYKISNEKYQESYNNLKQIKSTFIDKEWEYAISEFLTDNINIDELLKKANNNVSRLCEAYCYIGYKYLFGGNTELSKNYFKKCVDTKKSDFYEYALAICELEKL